MYKPLSVRPGLFFYPVVKLVFAGNAQYVLVARTPRHSANSVKVVGVCLQRAYLLQRVSINFLKQRCFTSFEENFLDRGNDGSDRIDPDCLLEPDPCLSIRPG